MRLFAALLLIGACNGQGVFRLQNVVASGGGGAYTYNKTITIDHTKVAATLTNYPLYFTTTAASLKATGSGGSVTDAQGDDIVFGTAAGCGTPLSYELERWVSTTGEVEFHILIPSLSSSVDTVIYLCAGNAAITSFQGGSTGAAWNSAYKGVYHIKDGTTLSLVDSTANGNNGTNTGTHVTATTGQIDGAGAFNGSNTDVDIPTISIASDLTVSAWVYSTNFSQNGMIVEKENVNGAWAFLFESGSWQFRGASSGGIGCSSFPSNSNWHLIVATITGTTGNLYLDGAAASGCTGSPAAIGNGSGHIHLGNYDNSGYFFTGRIDEVRISNVVRDANWISTEYNNQSSPGTFYSIT